MRRGERTPRKGKRGAGGGGNTVGMKSGGGDDALREEVTGFGVKPQRPVLAPEPEEPGARADVAARFLDRRCHLLGDGAEGDDPRRGGVDRGHASSVRLDLTKLLRRNRAKPGNSVLPPPLQKRLEPWSLLFGGRDDDFPRELEGNAILFAKAHHLRRPPDGNARLERAGLVVDARVEDSAIVPRLVEPDFGLFLQDQDRGARLPAQELEGGREPHDSASHDDHVVHGGGYGSRETAASTGRNLVLRCLMTLTDGNKRERRKKRKGAGKEIYKGDTGTGGDREIHWPIGPDSSPHLLLSPHRLFLHFQTPCGLDSLHDEDRGHLANGHVGGTSGRTIDRSDPVGMGNLEHPVRLPHSLMVAVARARLGPSRSMASARSASRVSLPDINPESVCPRSGASTWTTSWATMRASARASSATYRGESWLSR